MPAFRAPSSTDCPGWTSKLCPLGCTVILKLISNTRKKEASRPGHTASAGGKKPPHAAPSACCPRGGAFALGDAAFRRPGGKTLLYLRTVKHRIAELDAQLLAFAGPLAQVFGQGVQVHV